MIGDSVVPISSMLATAVQDSMSAELDEGLLHGNGTPPNPNGVLAAAPAAAAGDNLRTAVITVWGELVGAGTDPAYVPPTLAASELAAVDLQDRPVHDDGAALMLGPGIPMLPVAQLGADEALVADVTRVFLVIREDFRVDVSADAGFVTDSAMVRIRGRFNIAAPTPSKSMRMATVTP